MKCVIWVSYEVRMVAILRYYYINYFQQEPLYQWEFQFIRKYGTEKKVFSIHAGSRTKTGEVKTLGIFMYNTKFKYLRLSHDSYGRFLCL